MVIWSKRVWVLSVTMILLLIMILGCNNGNDSNNISGGTTLSSSAQRTIEFAGYLWKVKSSRKKVEPGPNYFSNSADNVWVDGDGYLHLKITQREGLWYCAEVVNQQSLGYGTYQFTIESPIDQIDKNAVLGLFTWDDNAPPNFREIDIEFSRWGEDEPYKNSQYVVQPYTQHGNRKRFDIGADVGESIHSFEWRSDGITFQSQQADPLTLLYSWNYVRGLNYPEPGNENIRFNLWLLEESIPSDGQEEEIIIKSFQFIPTS